MRFQRLIPVSLALLAAACASKQAGPTPETTATGTAALSSYPAAPSSIVSHDETGRMATTAAVDGQGGFSLALPAGHTYRLGFVTANREVPLVFPRASGRLETTRAVAWPPVQGAHVSHLCGAHRVRVANGRAGGVMLVFGGHRCLRR